MRTGFSVIAALALLLPAAALAQGYQPPRHTPQPSPLAAGATPLEIMLRADAGMQIERDRSPAAELEEHRKLERALRALAPHRAGIVDAYVVAVALDSDAVFAREARAAAEVLRRRYGAAARTVVLAGPDRALPSALPRGSPGTLGVALARIAELMNRSEDALILYVTGHGAPFGLYYHDGDQGYGAISPSRMRSMLDQLGLHNRLIILNACHAGGFVPLLQSPTSAIVAAAAADRSSFGCIAENDWTFFGDAMINRALRRYQPLAAAFAEASALVASWEAQLAVPASQPQLSVGAAAERWLAALDRRMPAAVTAPVGRPALDTTRAANARR